jgi:NAD-dependent DNA ligase
MTIDNISIMDGMGESSGNKILNQFDKIKNASYDKLGHSSSCFNNIGSKKIKMIIKGLGGRDEFLIFKNKYFENETNEISQLCKIHGVSDITAISFLNGIKCFEKFIKELGIEIKKEEEFNTELYKGRTFVFSGVRNKDLENYLISNGAEIKSGISKNITDLVVKDSNASTLKINKAKDLGINIIQIDNFKK